MLHDQDPITDQSETDSSAEALGGPENPPGGPPPDVDSTPEDLCARPKRGRPRPPKRTPHKPVYVSANVAAECLDMSVVALRATTRRHAKREATGLVSRLGGGVIGVQIGSRRWRYRIEPVT